MAPDSFLHHALGTSPALVPPPSGHQTSTPFLPRRQPLLWDVLPFALVRAQTAASGISFALENKGRSLVFKGPEQRRSATMPAGTKPEVAVITGASAGVG